jgi:hypothetical protein
VAAKLKELQKEIEEKEKTEAKPKDYWYLPKK